MQTEAIIQQSLLIWVDAFLRLDLERQLLNSVIGAYRNGKSAPCQDLNIDLIT